ncbi:unnamed protein product [Dracunculus medinensis]|uniref:MFS domain-containing protein n=1 Tax=Dracunculus medinensis TaxID=318479 RepID=A0A0N4UKX6_DRAME|nr:unnamed protein product [Dracunculus medinensis]
MIFNINRFYFFALLTWQFALFFSSQMIYPIFSNYLPKWRCSRNETFTSDCHIYLSCNQTVSFYSTALEYEWICGPKAYLASLYSQIQFFGVLIGTFLFGTLSDAFGRRPIAILALTTGIVVSFSSAFAPNWQLLLLSRSIVGLSIGGTIVGVCTYIMEMLLPEQRMALRAFFNWGVARLLLTTICYLLPDWRSSSIGNAIAASPALIIILIILPESPTWLHSKGRLEDMRKSEKYIARFANVAYEEKEIQKIEKKAKLIEIIRSPQYAKRLFVLWMMWFTSSYCGYAIDLNSTRISGNLFINQALFSILIAASKIMLVIYDSLNVSFNRRKLHQYAQACVCICFLILSILIIKYNNIMILIINLIGIVFIEYTWDACYLCAVEAMPTNMRASSLGSCSLIARIGALLSPMAFYFVTIWPPSVYLTVVIIGMINLIISYLFLIETKGVILDKVDVGEIDEQEKIPMMRKNDS